MSNTAHVQFFSFGNSRLAYRRFGRGPATLLAFHGFGQTGEVFSVFQQTLSEQYTVVAVDLFFHGQSCYDSPDLLTKIDWQRLIATFLQTQAVDRFSVLGFSLGGRFALTTVEVFADRIDELILIAPDGITKNTWYWLATNSGLGRILFRYVLRNLSIFGPIGHTLTRLGLLNRTAMRFAEIWLATPEQREQVYQTWTQFRRIRPDLNYIGKLLNDKEIRVRFFTGAFDRIVPGHYILPLAKRLRHYKLTVLRTGHNHLIELAAEQFV